MNIYKAITEEVLVPIHPAGWPFIFLFVLASILITVFWSPFAVVGTLLVRVFLSQSTPYHTGYG
jgi:phosphatidylserine decarboxylase